MASPLKKQTSLRFERKLILNQWILQQLEVQDFRTLGSKIESDQYEGFDSENKTQFYNILTSTLPFSENKLSHAQLLEYDQNIVRHWKRITENRNRLGHALFPKYFQYLSLLFTEIYLDRYFADARGLLHELNALVDAHNFEHGGNERDSIDPYSISELNKLAFWSATGSGKTLLMHINILQYHHHLDKYGKRGNLNRTILLTPNEGLSAQHLQEFYLSGIEAELFEKAGSSIFTGTAVEILEVTKLADESKVKTVAVEAFEGKNLVLVDEGHRGTSSEQGAWMEKRQKLCDEGFSFEYSATFGQAIKASKSRKLEQLYAKCILFDYSYKYFYGDGYGKDYRILNLEEGQHEGELRKYLTACLLTYYQQLKVYEDKQEDYRPYLIEKPLWIFVGGSVNAVRTQNKRQVSDVVEILLFFAEYLGHKDLSLQFLKGFLNGNSGLLTDKGGDLFANKFGYLAKSGMTPEELYDDILRTVFNSTSGGALHVRHLKGAEGEISISVGADSEPFGIINVGDASKLFSLCQTQAELITSERDFSGSYFRLINSRDSKINLLIGSKKFTEGWSSWRVSTMGLMNIGRTEGAMVIQLFGRGVRLKGFNFSLKRSRYVTPTSAPKDLSLLENLNIFGVRADYMRQFREYLADEGLPPDTEPIEFILPVLTNLGQKRLKAVKLQEGVDFKRQGRVPTLSTPEAAFLKKHKIELDWYPRVTAMSSGKGPETTVIAQRHQDWLGAAQLAILDYDKIYFELIQLKNERAWFNFNITQNSIKELLGRRDWYVIYIPKEELVPRSYAQVRVWQEIATALLKKYCKRFYENRKAEFENDKMELRELNPDDPNFMTEYRILIEQSEEAIIQKLEELSYELKSGKFRQWTFQGITSVFFANNLYQPLLHVANSLIEVRPVTLNDGERNFVEHLQDYCEKNKGVFANRELYLLRNRTKGSGIGFFEAGNFFPDFIVWIVEKDHQYISFIDPKGLRNIDGLEDPKIKFHQTIKNLEAKLADVDVTLNSFIVSVTPSQQVLWWLKDLSVEQLEEHNVLFQNEDRDNYIGKIIKRSLAVPKPV